MDTRPTSGLIHENRRLQKGVQAYWVLAPVYYPERASIIPASLILPVAWPSIPVFQLLSTLIFVHLQSGSGEVPFYQSSAPPSSLPLSTQAVPNCSCERKNLLLEPSQHSLFTLYSGPFSTFHTTVFCTCGPSKTS